VIIVWLIVITMKRRMHVRSIVTVLFLFLCATTIVAQESETDICVLEHLTAKALTGTVVSARLEGEIEKPLAKAAVELRRIGDQEVIAKTVTDSNGHFVLPVVMPGAYSLAAMSPHASRVALFATAVEVRLVGGKPEKKVERDYSGAGMALQWMPRRLCCDEKQE
jgi:hypothetical protein